MSRREFPKAVKVAVIRRATREGVTYCEGSGCGAIAKKWRIDHIRADGLLGEPTIENAQLLGPCCYAEKDSNDASAIALVKRQEAAHLGADKPKGSIPQKPKNPKTTFKQDQIAALRAADYARRYE